MGLDISVAARGVTHVAASGARRLIPNLADRRRLPQRRDDLQDSVPCPFVPLGVERFVDGRAAVVRLSGDLDLSEVEHLREVFDAILEPMVVTDIRRLTFIDSEALSALVVAQRARHDAGGTFQIRGAHGVVYKVFDAAGLLDVLSD